MIQKFTVVGSPVGFKRPERTRWGGRKNPDHYDVYKEMIRWAATQAKIVNVGKAPGNNQDIDNVAKAFPDALQGGKKQTPIAFDNDNMVGDIHIRCVDADTGKQVGNVSIDLLWTRHRKKSDRDKDTVEVTILNRGE